MCGIAGYSVSNRIYEKYLDKNPTRMKAILRQAWLHNLHRGYDASGYMAVAGDITQTWKHPGHAVDNLMNVIDKDDHKMPPAQTFGAHTRAYTIGRPESNENNHPVSHGGVHVVHNGHINNAVSVRNKWLDWGERKDAPAVDSYVIPLLLNNYVDNPFDIAAIRDALQELQGAFAIHAIWSQYPGVSLLARGSGRPLHFANLQGNVVAYGSEPQSIWGMVNAMGINPNKNFEWKSLDDDRFLIIENGNIVKWGSFKKDWSSKADKKVTRLLPKEKGINKKEQVIYESESKHDFLIEHPVRSLKGHERDATLRYERRLGFVNTPKEVKINEAFPMDKETALGAMCAEADRIYWYEDYWHIFINDIEIVLNQHKALRDIFRHDLFDNKERFRIKERPEARPSYVKESSMSLNDFLRLHCTHTAQKMIPHEKPEFEYVLRMQEEEKKNSKKAQTSLPMKKGTTHRTGEDTEDYSATVPQKRASESARIFEEEGDTDDESAVERLVDPPTGLDWENFYDATFQHATEDLFFVGSDRTCPVHDEVFSQHNTPEECEVLLLACSYAMSAIEDLTLFTLFDMKAHVEYDYVDFACDGDDDKMCEWHPAEFVKVTNNYTSWLVRQAEVCLRCGSTRRLNQLPAWFEMLNVSAPLVLEKAE